MKKFLTLVLFFFLFLFLSCQNRYISKNIYNRTFYDKEYALSTIEYQLRSRNFNIPDINKWMSLYSEVDTILINQKMMHSFINNDSRYQFIFTTFNYPSSISYQFIIRFIGLRRDFK